MIRLKIISKDKYDYCLLDNAGKKYNINIDFINTNYIPGVDDYLYLTKEMIEEVNIYTFGPLSKNINTIDGNDIIKVSSGSEEFFLQRYYG